MAHGALFEVVVVLRADGAGAQVGPHPRSLQEAVGYPSIHNGLGSLWLLLRVIAEHVRQHLGVKDAARRGDESAEILLPIESITEADAFGREMRRGDAWALIGADLHPLPVFARGPGAVELAAGAGRGSRAGSAAPPVLRRASAKRSPTAHRARARLRRRSAPPGRRGAAIGPAA